MSTPQASVPPALEKLWARGANFLGCPISILGGAMTWLSERHLVSAISNAGGFGVVACGSMNTEMLDQEIVETAKMTSNPFGVNLITMHPDLDALIDVCADNKVTHVVLAGGVPSRDAIKKVKANGAKVICFTPAIGLAKRLISFGVDALVIEGAEAGGHIGPVSTSVLAQEILPVVKEVPIFIAGGIGRGEAIVTYLEMGAAGCQMGTRFVCAFECIAHPRFKQSFIRANARDAVPTTQVDKEFPVIPVRALTNNGTEEFVAIQRKVIEQYQRGELDQKAAQLEIEHFWAGALRRAVLDGDVKNGSMMAGQSVGMVTSEQSVSEIIDDLMRQAIDSLQTRIRH